MIGNSCMNLGTQRNVKISPAWFPTVTTASKFVSMLLMLPLGVSCLPQCSSVQSVQILHPKMFLILIISSWTFLILLGQCRPSVRERHARGKAFLVLWCAFLRNVQNETSMSLYSSFPILFLPIAFIHFSLFIFTVYSHLLYCIFYMLPYCNVQECL